MPGHGKVSAAAKIEDSDYLESIDRSLTTIKRIAIWFLALSIIALVVGLLQGTHAF
jgi:hypothetical protein